MVRARSSVSGQSPASSPAWQPVGPFQISTSTWNLLSGPVESLAADPSDPSGNTLYAGTDGGGVWKSTNAAGSVGGVSFIPLTDTLSAWSSAALTSLSIGAITVQPGGTGVILAGTGNPNNATSSWYGAGVLRSTDAGITWNLIHATSASLSSSGIFYSFYGNAFAGFAWGTANPNLVVAAVTNSGYGLIAGTTGSQSILGLYYSPDAGVSWNLATLEDGSQVIQSDQFANDLGNAATSVVWNPIRKRFYAAIRFHGYYESTDGITWTRLTNQPGVNLTTSLCPANPGLPASPACPIFRGALAVQPVTGDIFALTVDENDLDQGLWQDVCHITSGSCASPTVQFATQITDTPLDSMGDGVLSQADYDLWLAAVPSQQDTLLFAGTEDIWKCSLANSCVWRNATNTQTCAAAHVAPDQHSFDGTFGSAGLLYFGNDGGIWRSKDDINQEAPACSSDDGSHFQNLNGGIGSLAEVESFSEDPNQSATLLAALGDLGTAAPGLSPTVWNQVLNGEGDGTAIDPTNPDNWYATSMFGVGINRCTEGSSCNNAGFGTVAIGEAQVDNDFQTIPAPWILDPLDSTSMIVGTCRVWRGPTSGNGWSQLNLISSMLDGDQNTFCDGNAEIRSLAAGPNTASSSVTPGEQIYAGIAGVLDGGGLIPGHFFTASVNATSQPSTTTWVDRYASPVTNMGGGGQFNPDAYGISSIYSDPHDPTGQTVYVTIQGISGASGHEPLLYRSTDAGAHWTDISSNLPTAPANSVTVDPNDANIVYVALETGVYITQNVANCSPLTSACWNVYGSGLPNSPVISLLTYQDFETQSLRAATYGRGIWQVALATAGVAPTTITAVPDVLTFNAQADQTVSVPQSITLTNTGTADLDITSITIAGDYAETDACTGGLMVPGATCQVNVTFDPTLVGTESGTLTVFANISGGQLTVPLHGTGLPPATVVLTPSSLSFSGTTLGNTSAPQYVNVANTGGESVALTSETLTGDFSISANTCGNSLTVNNSCTLAIVFTPTASGTRSGSLTVEDAAGTQTVLLSGTGQSVATDSLSPAALTFQAQQVGTTSSTQQITLTNNGDQPLTSIQVKSSGDFIAINNCGTLLQGHATCAITVAYVPTVVGPESGTLTVSDEFRSQSISLAGTGVAPPGVSATPISINFGGYAVGTTSSPKTVTVTNSGGYALAGLSAAVSQGFAFAGNDCPVTLTIGSTCQIGITFSPAAAGAIAGTLTISASNINHVLTVTLSGSGDDFSIAVSGSSSAIITSGQTASFALQLEGLGGTSGTVTLSCSGTPQYSTCSLNPTSIGITSQNSSSVTASVATGVSTTTAALHQGTNWKGMLPLMALAIPIWWASWRRGSRVWSMIVIVAIVLTIAGCGVSASSGSGSGGGGSGGGGGTGGSQNQTPAGTYTVTVTGSMSNITHSVKVSLTVQ